MRLKGKIHQVSRKTISMSLIIMIKKRNWKRNKWKKKRKEENNWKRKKKESNKKLKKREFKGNWKKKRKKDKFKNKKKEKVMPHLSLEKRKQAQLRGFNGKNTLLLLIKKKVWQVIININKVRRLSKPLLEKKLKTFMMRTLNKKQRKTLKRKPII